MLDHLVADLRLAGRMLRRARVFTVVTIFVVALGARQGDVLRLVVGDGLRLTLTGVALGLVLAAFATRLLGGLLLGVSPLDGATFAAMSLAFVAVTLVASWLPARRAAAADPVTVLRSE